MNKISAVILTKNSQRLLFEVLKSLKELDEVIILDNGSNDAAGFIMPNGLRNVLVIHASIQEWQYIIGLRTCKRNSLETRYVCYKIWEALYETPKGELLFSPKNTGSWCQTGSCREGRMSCGEPLPTDMTPTQMLHQYFPLCYKEA